MNRRYLDPLFFTFLFALDMVVWLITLATGNTPDIVAVMAPAFGALAVLALVRSLLDLEPKRFWSGLAFVTLVFGVFVWLAETLVPNLRSVEFTFTVAAKFMAVSLLGSIIVLFLALVGAISAPREREAKSRPAEASAVVDQNPVSAIDPAPGVFDEVAAAPGTTDTVKLAGDTPEE